jgi:glycosyltransferase involved in cell wall biosynthesis
VEFVGKIGDGEKEEFLGNAYAVLFPIDWPDPFGFVMIETMACGTPVIVYESGSVPEVREQGRTGFIVKELDDVVQAVQRVSELSRKRCREVFDQRFMASDYVRVYERIIWRKSKSTLAA